MEGLAAIGSAQRGTMWTSNPVSAASSGAQTGDVSVASKAAAYGNIREGVSVSFSKESLNAANASKTSGGSQELTEEEKKEVEDLKKRDQEVRQHEQAHIAAGGRYVLGGASYTYTQGPDGKAYASGGEVSIDVSPESDPSATIRKMQLVERAALAPANPSSQDRGVAAQARQAQSQAQAEVQKKSSSSSGATGIASAAAGPQLLDIVA